MIPDSFIQDLLARVDVVDVVGRYVQLRKGGANLLGLCPFHNEKSPSFTVSPTKQFYHCFGCGAHGTAIRFLMDHAGQSFPEAVRSLADSAGMRVPEEDRSPKQREARAKREAEISRHSQALETANTLYRQQLRTATAAVSYLKGRGLSGEVAARFGMGWASGDRQGLSQVFPTYDDPLLVEAGLVILSEDGRRYDRFRERIMFPIRNGRGHLIGFGGRIVGKGEPKYLNSPETPIFSKGTELYGLWEAKQAIRSAGQVVVVEGYMDVVALAQMGVEHAVATLGTATTPVHIQKLLRASDNVVFAFDGDKAGRKAAWRALEACLPLLRDDVSLRFLFLPDDHDPDSFIREFGLEGFRAALRDATALSQFMLGELAERHRMDEAEGRARCVHDAKPLLQAMPAGAIRLQIQRELATLTRLTPEELGQLLQLQDVPSGPLVQQAAAAWGNGSTAPAARGAGGRQEGRASAQQGGQQDGYQGGPPSDYGPDDHDFMIPDDDSWEPAGRSGGEQGRANVARQASEPRGRRVVASLPVRLLHLLLGHPALIEEIDEAAETVLQEADGFDQVRELLALMRETGASHAAGLIEAARGTALGQDLENEMVATMFGEELPDPQGELRDALRVIELGWIEAQKEMLIARGLSGVDDKARYFELNERVTRLRMPLPGN
ncbi:DNA primase [Pigmentiphaga aceris]|uniref:DNA primase n=1 Tax=Pigmentiphaga aceris TaxID=1940612 RepID=A0A5C0B458_9BURK|nr:DNA primase [Pigmentiphaga aceris]QEI08040.1 DNA primase [Pigmentiphaga aceris]